LHATHDDTSIYLFASQQDAVYCRVVCLFITSFQHRASYYFARYHIRKTFFAVSVKTLFRTWSVNC